MSGGGARRPAIVTCAPTGSVHVPSLSPALPVTPTEIAAAAIEAAEAGAAIVHLHARDPRTGEPSGDPEIFRELLTPIHAKTDAVINISTGGSSEMSLDERLAAVREFQPELCSCNMGTMNFGFWGLIESHGRDRFERDWEIPFLEDTRRLIFQNTFEDIEMILREMGTQRTRFEFECYDISHLYTLAYMVKQGLARPPFYVQFVMGVMGGIAASVEHLVQLKGTADRLLGDEYLFSVMAAGRHQIPVGTTAAVLGGSVRVGLEDNLYIGPDRLADSNAQQVEKIIRILDELDIPTATPDEARELLDLKGRDAVAM